jgi:hypothetical protein
MVRDLHILPVPLCKGCHSMYFKTCCYHSCSSGLVVPLWIRMLSSWATEKGLNGNVQLYLFLIVTRFWGSAVVLSYTTVKLWLDIEWLTVLYNSKYLNHCLRGWLYVPFNADNSKLGWFILQSTVNSSSTQVFPVWIHLFICVWRYLWTVILKMANLIIHNLPNML